MKSGLFLFDGGISSLIQVRSGYRPQNAHFTHVPECTRNEKCEREKVILREVKLKIELPSRCSWWVFTLLIHKSEAQLDYLEQVHIAAQQLVLVVSIASEFSDWSGNNTWKLCVL